MKEKGSKSGKHPKRIENEESGELSSSSSSSSSSASSRHRSRSRSSSSNSSSCSLTEHSRKPNSKKSRKLKAAEDGEIDSESETPTKPEFKTKPVDNEVRLQQLRKLIERTKVECEEARHKLAKIERAYLKAEVEKNKANMKKCLKYKDKYGLKVDKLKESLKMYQAKKVKLAVEMKTGQSSSQTKASMAENTESSVKISPSQSKNKIDTERKRKTDGKEKEEASDTKRQRLSPTSMPKKNLPSAEVAAVSEQQMTTAGKPVTEAVSKTTVIKLPFPVLNDKRNMKIILGTLETKRNELVKKCDQNAQTLKILTKKGVDKTDERFDKLKQLEQVFESQRDKIEKQLEYVRLAVSLDVLRTRTGNVPALILQNKHAIDQMTSQLNDMYNYMKQENNAAVIKQQELANEAEAAAAEEAARKESAEKLKTLYNQTNNSLAALIAHVAATAHAAASCVAGNHFYTTYFPQPETEISLEIKKMQSKPLPVPSKTELAKASTTFASLKDKISSFFEESKKQEEKLSGAKASTSKGTIGKKSGLNLLVSYGDEEEDEEEEMEEKIKDEAEIVESKEPVKAKSGDTESSDDSDSDIEIVTTSELKAGSVSRRNYLLPSLKASYFPLKASINSSDHFMQRFGQTRQNDSLKNILYR